MRRSCFWLFPILFAVLLLCAGCKPLQPAVPLYTEKNPGPWKNVKAETLFAPSEDGEMALTVRVKEFPTQKDNYVLKLSLADHLGRTVGERVFDYGADPVETFKLPPPEAGQMAITVTVTSTGWGLWRLNPVVVPPKK